MKFTPKAEIERVRWNHYAVVCAYPQTDEARVEGDKYVVPVTAIATHAHTWFGALREARKLERIVAVEAAA